MSFSSESIRILQVIGRTGNFVEAAKELHRVPSAVTYMVKKLEEDVGVKLFDRTNRKVTLTPAAEYLIENSHWLLMGIEDLRHNAALIDQGVNPHYAIALNYIVNPEGLDSLMPALLEAFPATEFTVQTEVYNGCWDALYERRVDFVIGATHAKPVQSGISTHYIGSMDWEMAVATDHPLAGLPEPLTSAKLRQFPVVVVKDTSIQLQKKRTWALDGQRIIYVPDLDMAMRFIRQGMAIGYLPAFLVRQAVERGEMITKQVTENKQLVPLYFAWSEHSNSPIQHFLLQRLLNKNAASIWIHNP